MIIGGGQLATALQGRDRKDVCMLASGVSNSSCVDQKEFERERNLINNCLKNFPGKKVIYFSSCALDSPAYSNVPYYEHKKKIEDLLQEKSSSYLIFRIPQLFGELKPHPTLINFIFHSILCQKKFAVNELAYRYVIDIDDLCDFVSRTLALDIESKVINVANPYQYKVSYIVKIIEELLRKDAVYESFEKKDSYKLNLDYFNEVCGEIGFGERFSESYLFNRLNYRVKQYMQKNDI